MDWAIGNANGRWKRWNCKAGRLGHSAVLDFMFSLRNRSQGWMARKGEMVHE